MATTADLSSIETAMVLQALVREHPGEAIYTDELRITMDAFGLLDAL
jgi:hypothetical protein